MSTTSKTVRGKIGSRVSRCGTYPGGARRAFETVLNPTREYGNQSEDAAQEGGLASTVWPHQGQAFATCDRKREVLEHDSTVVPEAHIAEREERPRHYPPWTPLSMVRIL